MVFHMDSIMDCHNLFSHLSFGDLYFLLFYSKEKLYRQFLYIYLCGNECLRLWDKLLKVELLGKREFLF